MSETMTKYLFLIRGLPGSGKTTIAKRLVQSDFDCEHFEADMFFEDSRGNYCFEKHRVPDAHKWCQKRTRIAMAAGRNVVVANTFTTQKELEPYYNFANEFGYEITIIKCVGQWKSIHNVPDEVMEAMRKRWEDVPNEEEAINE